MPIPWDDYISTPTRPTTFDECHSRCKGAFARQRENIRRMIDALAPRTVACLGAGMLNDIPYRQLVRSGATIHLVDWLPGVVEAGVSRSIIVSGESGAPECIYCALGADEAGAHCRQFKRSGLPVAGVCEHYAPRGDDAPGCASFEMGELPACHEHDVTGGYAVAFAREVFDELPGIRSWRQAFRHALAIARRVKRHNSSLAIADASVDFVTSSMLLSQFEHEPYNYFSRQVAGAIGTPGAQDEKRLGPAMTKLRATLAETQIEKHCDEIERILAPGGRCFVSFELFHRSGGSEDWFLVDEMQDALRLLARRFAFDLDVLPEDAMVTRFERDDWASLVCSLVLAHKRR